MAKFSFADTSYGLGEAAARRRFEQSGLQRQLQMANLGQTTQRQLRDVNQQYRRATEPQITGFTGRGLGRSGLFRQAMQDFVGGQQQRVGDIASSQAAGQASLELEGQMAAQALQDELDRLQLERQQQILADAAQIKGWSPSW
jgi:hypothetical protein